MSMIGKVYGVSMVYNAEDIIEAFINNAVYEGFDGLIILDNFSIDGTQGILDRKVDELAESNFDLYVLYSKQKPFYKAKKMNGLAALANYRAWDTVKIPGWTWIVPMDQDEIWTTDRYKSKTLNLAEFLKLHMGISCFYNYMRNYISTSLDDKKIDNPIERMKYYLPPKDKRQQIKNEKTCYIYHPEHYSPSGHHHLHHRAWGPIRGSRAPWLIIKHYPYRSLEQVKDKYRELYKCVMSQKSRDPHGDRHVIERGRFTDKEFREFWDEYCFSKDPEGEKLIKEA